MKSALSRTAKVLAMGALGAVGAYALAQQMIGPPTTAPDEKAVAGQKAKGGYFPDRMKNPNLNPHPGKLTVTPPNEIPLDRIKVPQGFQVEIWAHGRPVLRMMKRGLK